MASRAAAVCTLILVALLTGCGPPAALAPPSSYQSTADASLAYQEAIARDPNDAYAHLWLGKLLLQEGRAQEAKDHLAKVTEIDPSLTEAFVLLGSQLEAEGKNPEALRLYNAAIEGNPAVHQLVERTHDLETRRASAFSGLDAAWALVAQGRAEEAAGILRALPSDLPDEPRVQELIARASLDIAQSLLTYDERKVALADAETAVNEATRLGSASMAPLVSVIDSLQREDEEQVAQAREEVEAGGETFNRDVCVGQKAPLLTITNRRGYDLTLDLRFSEGATQWVVVSDQVTLRAGPSREAERVGLLPRGTAVWIRRPGPDNYVQVVSAAGEGWVANSMIERTSFVSFSVRAGATLSVILNPGVAQYRLGRGIRSLAEGTEHFLPYLCYSWE